MQTCAGRPATFVGTDGPDSFVGTEGADVAWLGPGADEAFGHGGADIICGGSGNDFLSGQEGADRSYGEGGNDQLLEDGADVRVHGGEGNDLFMVGVAARVPGMTGVLRGGAGRDSLTTLGAESPGVVVDVPAERITRGDASYVFTGFEAFSLTQQHDVFRGGPGSEHISGGEGGDDLSMGGGDDIVELPFVSQSDSVVHMGDGEDHVRVSTGGLQQVWLGAGDDTALISASVHLFAGAGNDRIGLRGSGGRDWNVRGESGRDLLDFFYMNRALRLDVGAGTARFGNGHTHLFGGVERFRGTQAPDVLLGSDGPDTIHGYLGADTIRGRRGNDILIGDQGTDVIRGQRGFDICSRGNTQGCERLR